MPVTLNVVTGILGSGKTTVLLHLFDAPSVSRKPAVVVGEFAEEGLDGALLASAGATVRQITGSGLGAEAKSYVSSIQDLIDDGEHPRIFLETSGVTDIGRVAAEIAEAEELAGEIDIGTTVTVLDAGAFTIHDKFFPAQLWAQVDVADVVIVNKTDRSNPEELERIRDRVKARNPATRVLFAYMGQVRRAEVLGGTPEGFVPRLLSQRQADSTPADFESFVYRSKVKCIDRVIFGHRLLNLPGGHIARFKGVLQCWDRSYTINGLPGQLDWDNTPATGRTRIAFIGLDLLSRKDAICELLDKELQDQQEDLRR